MTGAYIPAEQTGKVHDNTENKTAKKHPDYTGLANINGQIFRVAAWYSPPNERNRKATINFKFTDRDKFNREQQAKREDRENRKGNKARDANLADHHRPPPPAPTHPARCPACGELGARRGHMGCRYPSATPDQGGPPEEDNDADIPF